MKSKDYQKLNSLQLEDYLKELLNFGLIKNQEQKKELKNLYEQLKEQNKHRFYFILNEIENWYKYALKQNDEVMRLSMEEMLTALIKWENAEELIKEWEEEIQNTKE